MHQIIQFREDFVKPKLKEYELELYIQMANIKEMIMKKIRHTLNTMSLAEIMLQVGVLDFFEYLSMQVIYYVMKKERHASEEELAPIFEHLKNLTFKKYFVQMERNQVERHQIMAQRIREIENISIDIENLVDFDILKSKKLSTYLLVFF